MLYFDFSGNSDMSIGISAMLGYKVEENFIKKVELPLKRLRRITDSTCLI